MPRLKLCPPRSTASAATALALLAAACSPSERPRPNVLLVTLDTTRADYLGVYGGASATPSFDAVAARGTVFDLAIATASVTPVSHASIMTGRENKEHGVRVLYGAGGYRLPDGLPTLATVLHEEGYRTGAVQSAFPVSAFFGFDRGFDLFDDLEATFVPIGPAGEKPRFNWNVSRFQRRSDATTDRALEFLDGAGGPFFLWIHYWDPHDTAELPPAGLLPDTDSTSDPYGKEVYAAEVRFVDSQFGRILDDLERRGLADDTIVVIVADHGQGLGDHDWATHRLLYQEQIRLPLIVSVPGHEQVARVPALVRSTDILPTVLDYLGIPVPAGVSGRSLRGLIEGRSEPRRIAFSDQLNQLDLNAMLVTRRPLDDFLYSATDGTWKLIYRPTHPHLSELFDLTADPLEARNLFQERPDEALRLLKDLAREAPWVTGPLVDASADDPDVLAALSALGYAAREDGEEPNVPEWSWTCPDPAHRARSDSPGRCPECDTPLVPVARTD